MVLALASQIAYIRQELLNYINSSFLWRWFTEEAYATVKLIGRLFEQFLEGMLLTTSCMVNLNAPLSWINPIELFLFNMILAVKYQLFKINSRLDVELYELPRVYSLLSDSLSEQFTLKELFNFIGWDKQSRNIDVQLTSKPDDNYSPVLESVHKQLLSNFTGKPDFITMQGLEFYSLTPPPAWTALFLPKLKILFKALKFLTAFYNSATAHPLKRTSSLVNDCALIFIHQTALTNLASKPYTFNGLQPYDFLDEKSSQHGDSNHALVHIYSLYSLLVEQNGLTVQELDMFLQASPMQDYCCLVWRAASDAMLRKRDITVPLLADFGNTGFIQSEHKRLPFGEINFTDNEKLYSKALAHALL